MDWTLRSFSEVGQDIGSFLPSYCKDQIPTYTFKTMSAVKTLSNWHLLALLQEDLLIC